MKFQLHPNAICESRSIGAGTRIWAFAHVLAGAVVGRDCNICDHVFIENDVRIGDRVTIKCGVQLWDGLRIEDDVFIGPNATFTNDHFPRSKRYQKKIPVTVLGAGASIGANATVLPGLTIGRGAFVGAGAVVTHSVPSHAIVTGSPARIVGYVDARGKASVKPAGLDGNGGPAVVKSKVQGVSLVRFPWIQDMRGDLSVGEFRKQVPFAPRRYFLVFSVPSKDVRGEHAHRKCRQFLICVHGSCSAVVDDGKTREEFRLSKPNVGLYIPPMVWATQYKYSQDAVLLVFASHPYDPKDYIRDYQRYLREKAV